MLRPLLRPHLYPSWYSTRKNATKRIYEIQSGDGTPLKERLRRLWQSEDIESKEDPLTPQELEQYLQAHESEITSWEVQVLRLYFGLNGERRSTFAQIEERMSLLIGGAQRTVSRHLLWLREEKEQKSKQK